MACLGAGGAAGMQRSIRGGPGEEVRSLGQAQTENPPKPKAEAAEVPHMLPLLGYHFFLSSSQG